MTCTKPVCWSLVQLPRRKEQISQKSSWDLSSVLLAFLLERLGFWLVQRQNDPMIQNRGSSYTSEVYWYLLSIFLLDTDYISLLYTTRKSKFCPFDKAGFNFWQRLKHKTWGYFTSVWSVSSLLLYFCLSIISFNCEGQKTTHRNNSNRRLWNQRRSGHTSALHCGVTAALALVWDDLNNALVVSPFGWCCDPKLLIASVLYHFTHEHDPIFRQFN